MSTSRCPRDSPGGSSSPGRGPPVLNETIDGRVVLAPDVDGDERYELAVDGHALAGATARQPVTRDTAQRALDGFLARVEEINANPLAEWAPASWSSSVASLIQISSGWVTSTSRSRWFPYTN